MRVIGAGGLGTLGVQFLVAVRSVLLACSLSIAGHHGLDEQTGDSIADSIES